MDGGSRPSGARHGPWLGGLLALSAILLGAVDHRDGPAMGLAAARLASRLPDVFPSLAMPGVLDGRGISGLVQRALFGLEMLMLIALAVRLLRVAVTSAREIRQPARVEAT